MTPVPATSGRERAGTQSSISSDRNTTAVANLAAVVDTNTSESNTMAFKRSNRMQRSPIKATVIVDLSDQARDTDEQLPIVTSDILPASPDKSMLSRLGEQIRNLIEMLEDGKRRSIHQPMRDAIQNIKHLYEAHATEVRDEKAKEVIKRNNFSQTSPAKKTKVRKRKQKGALTIQTSKRQVEDTLLEETESSSRKDSTTEPENAPSLMEKRHSMDGSDTGWQRVRGRKEAKAKKENLAKLRKVRPDAIVIAKKGDLSYAEILRQVKADPKLKELSDTVSKIRRTQKGDLLFQLNGTGEKTEKLKTVIGELLGEQASTHCLRQKTLIEIKDLDEITSKEDISEAINSQFEVKSFSKTDILSLRKSYGGTQTAKIYTGVDVAKTLLESGEIKIGWVICRIRRQNSLVKCYRCLEFGHMAKRCGNEQDRSKQCRRCGMEGHIAKGCTLDPICMLCREDKSTDARHVAGSSSCPRFRRALTSRHIK